MKKLEELTITEFLMMKEDIEDVYGEGTFAQSIQKDIASILGLFEMDLPVRNKTQSTDPVVQNKKSFAEALLNVNPKNPKTRKAEVQYVPFKPILNPTMAGGNIIVEVDEEEYHRAEFSVIGKLNLKRGNPVPTTMEIRRKLCEFWKINVLFCSLKDQCEALSVSSVFLKPGLIEDK